jgi:peptide/nickel transport system permease protein
MYLGFRWFGFASTGLLSSEYIAEPWSAAKVLDLLMHLPLPVVVIGIAGTAGLIRVLRATLLDEHDKPYVVTARAKGVPEGTLLLKYPVRVAVNPLVSTIGWSLAGIVSGATIVDIVLNLPTTGPLLLDAIMKQDMALAGSIIMILSALTVIGTFVSDVLLVLVDPRIRHA